MASTMITANEVRRLLYYSPETGVFYWKERRGGRASAGSIAGSLQDNGYVHILIHRRGYSAHRLAWLYVHGEWPPEQIDHINRIRHDNRLANLRLATRFENAQNTSLRKNNLSGVRGVSWYKKSNRWIVRVYAGKKIYWSKYFTCFAQAVKARRAVEAEAHPFRTP